MSDGTFRSVRAMKREISADKSGSLFKILAGLWPYIWPSDRRDLKIRVLIAMGLLLLAKLATIAVPFTFKWAVDALTGQDSAPVAASSWFVSGQRAGVRP
jgi:ATP-binding cassette subfamily B protein